VCKIASSEQTKESHLALSHLYLHYQHFSNILLKTCPLVSTANTIVGVKGGRNIQSGTEGGQAAQKANRKGRNKNFFFFFFAVLEFELRAC
jgi:hypothetical protein